jgi:hypothetical protein
MKRILPTTLGAFCALLLLCTYAVSSQTATVFNDDFSASAGTTFTTAAGAIGTSTKWNMTRSGTDFGAKINTDFLTLSNDATTAGNTYGWVLASTSAAAFTAPYNTTLGSNPGMVTWTFNMRQIRSNPNGFGTTNYGAAFILAGTAGTTNVAGTGYAVVLGNSGTTDPIKLVRYSAGIRTFTTMITSNTIGLTDFGNQYLSVKVTYTPSTNTWQLYLRNDGTTAFADPNTGTLTSQGTLVNNTYTAAALPLMGAYWNGYYSANQTSFFDNARVTVAVPVTTSLSPSSKIAGTGAFTLTVNGANFVSGTSTVNWNGSPRTTTYVSPTQLTASILAADVASSGTASVTVANGTAVSNAQNFIIDLAGTPTVSTSLGALPAFSTVTGIASTASTFTVSGANLTSDVTVTPPSGFEVSTNGTTYFSSINLTRTGNVLVGQPVTVYCRVAAATAAGIYSGSINHTATGATAKTVSVSATVLSTQPTTQATAVSFTNVSSTAFTVNWTNGNGTNRLVLIRSGSAVNSNPVDGVVYTPNTAFGYGSEIGTGNYTAYTGTSNTVTVTGLQPATTYHVAVYEFNGASFTENYNTTAAATGNRTTLNAPIGWQIYTANTLNKITFDSTVDGVNESIFQGDGLAPVAGAGELNSNAWAISGFSDGNVAFGGTSAEDSDYDRGESEGGETDGGVYAFATAANNYSLGFQPATGDFAPGTATLRFQNQTGAAITSLSIGYKVAIYNDQAASSSFNFSHSADNSAYIAIAGMNVASPATADVNPQWKSYYRVVTITGLNIASNNYYYLRWSGATLSGSINFDEFALDDIMLVANPTANFASFSGTAESFVVNGNTSLTADTTVASDLTLNAGKLDIGGRTLTVNGTIANNVAGGLKGSATSNLMIGGAVGPTLSFDQTTAGTTNVLNNLSINTTAANTTTISNPVVVNGTLTTAAGQTLNMGTNALTGTLTTIANNGTIATQNTTATPIPTGKTWSGTGTILYNDATPQTVVVGTYQNLTVSGAAGATAAGSFTVNGILNLPTANPSATAGSLSMATYTLTMGGSAVNTGIGDVTGIVARNTIVANTVYTFGQAGTSIIFPNVGTLPTSMSLKIAIGTVPSWRTGAINRTYDFIQSGGSGTKAVIKAHYLDSELNGNVESRLVDWSYIVASSTVLEQGRSNYNTVDNWIELTNVNVGLYFTSSFGNVLLTLDESAAGSLRWNGSVSDSWTTAANWTPNATPSDNTVVYIPDANTTPNDPLVNPLTLLGALNIETGGIVNAPTNCQFTINGGAGAWINNGTYNPGTGTSTVFFTSTDATMAGTTNFNNVTINSGATLRPLTDNIMRIGGAFTISGTFTAGAIENTVEYTGSGQTVPSPNGSFTAYHNLIISGTGAVFPTTLNVTGDVTFNQLVDFTGKTLTLNGSESQHIKGTANPVFNNLTINNTQGDVALDTNASVSGTLTLTSGRLDLGSRNLTLGANAVAGTFSSTRMIVASGTGELRRTFTGTGSYTFPIGDNTNAVDYSPITINVTAGSFSGAYVGVSVTDAIHPNNSSVANNLSRYWKVNQSGITGALATITAIYTAEDLTGAENSISAAQLNGTFNQANNPWVKFAALGSSTLTATGVTLTAGQTSAFTGIKGAAFTATLMGYGAFCQNQSVTLEASYDNGDAPYTYLWSNGLGTQSTATPPTTTPGTVNYTVTLKDANGITATDNANVTTLAPTQGGTVSSSQTVCAGTLAADLTLSGNVGSVVHWQSSSDVGFTSPVNIGNTTTTLTGAAIGPLTATTYFRAVIQNGSCLEAFSSVVTLTVKSTTWNGTAWNNGAPDSTTTAIITGNYTSSANLNACTLTVDNAATVSILSGHTVTLNGALTVTSGSFTLENNAALIQSQNVSNSGNIVVKRNSSALKRQDYTLWSAPVAGQNLLAFSPATLPNRFYTYNPATDLYAATTPSTNNFNVGQGYLIRMPNNHPTTATIWNGQFTGVPNNGNIPVTMSNTYNLVGNPYPSPMSMATFVSENTNAITGTLYFWRETNNNTSNNAYCSWSGGTFTGNGEAQVFNPNGIIQTGQGFFVAAKPGQTALNFRNTQRTANTANQFFRNADEDEERHTIWLNATNSEGLFSQMAVGYITGATMDVDMYDGMAFPDGDIALGSWLDNSDYVIQGRPVPFNTADVVPLTFRCANAGNYTITIDHLLGLFEGSQSIYLKDNLTNAIHDLKASAYDFVSESGIFTSRFELVYQDNPLAVTAQGFNANTVIVYKQSPEIVVNAGKTILSDVKVYDIRGRLIAGKENINAAETRLNVGTANEVLIVKITSDKQETVTRKIVN